MIMEVTHDRLRLSGPVSECATSGRYLAHRRNDRLGSIEDNGTVISLSPFTYGDIIAQPECDGVDVYLSWDISEIALQSKGLDG